MYELLSKIGLSAETMQFIKEYQFILAVIFTTFGYWLVRVFPKQVLQRIKDQLVLTYTIGEPWNVSGDIIYNELVGLVTNHRIKMFSKKFRLVQDGSVHLNDGNHLTRLNGALCLAQLYRKEYKGSASSTTVDVGYINITVLRWQREKVEQLLIDIAKTEDDDLFTVCLMSSGGDILSSAKTVRVRYSNALQYCSKEIYDKIDQIFDRFVNHPEYYSSRNRSRKETILLYGVPGTGKTNLYRHFCAKYNLPVGMYTAESLSYMGWLPSIYPDRAPQVAVFEDICRNRVLWSGANEVKGPTDLARQGSLDKALNLLDGALPIENKIVILTANNTAVLDRALYRMGRVDHVFEMGYLSRSEAIEILKGYTPQEFLDYVVNHVKFINITAAMLSKIRYCETTAEIDEVLDGGEVYHRLSTHTEQTASSYIDAVRYDELEFDQETITDVE